MNRRRVGQADSGMRVAVITNVLPHYREALYRLLFERADLDVYIYCEAVRPRLDLNLIHNHFPDRVTLVRAWRLGPFTWQRLPWRELLRTFDVLCVHGDARTVSNVALSWTARIVGMPTFLWGQAHTAGARKWLEAIRLGWWRRIEHVLVYSDSEARWLIEERGFRRNSVLGINNGLDQIRIDEAAARWGARELADWRARQGLTGCMLVLSCARLESKNEFDRWVSAMPEVRKQYPDLRWCVIGDGPMRAPLELAARALGVDDSIVWLGARYDEDELAPWFLSSRILVHPGAIGLTVLHAFGYGLPVITHDDSTAHMPEFCAFASGETGVLFRRSDASSLVEAVCTCLADETGTRRMGEHARRIAREKYNVSIMADRFATMARHVARTRDFAAPVVAPARRDAGKPE